MHKDYTNYQNRPVMTRKYFIEQYPDCTVLFLFPGVWDTTIMDEKFEVLCIVSNDEISKLKRIKRSLDKKCMSMIVDDSFVKGDINIQRML